MKRLQPDNKAENDHRPSKGRTTKSFARWTPFLCGVAAFLAAGSTLVMTAAPPIPDPCKLITQAELEQIAGPMKGAPKAGDIASGDVSCEYKPVKTPSWISIRLQDGELSYWKSRNGGKNPVALPEFGKDAFVNADSEGSADLYAKKGNLILRVSMPKGPAAVDMVKAIAKKALPRL
jgi:hypothetical protein